jgi:hypothetical protein
MNTFMYYTIYETTNLINGKKYKKKMGKSRKNRSSSFKREKNHDAYYEDSYVDIHKPMKGNKPAKGQRDSKSRDHPSEYIDWDSL